MTEFVQNVLKRLDRNYTLKERDRESTVRALEHLEELEFDEKSAFFYVRCTEEVNPELDEEVALRRMHEIGSKFPKYLAQCKSGRK